MLSWICMNKRTYLIKLTMLCHHKTCIARLALIRLYQRPSANKELHGLNVHSSFNSPAVDTHHIRQTFVLDISDTKVAYAQCGRGLGKHRQAIQTPKRQRGGGMFWFVFLMWLDISTLYFHKRMYFTLLMS